MSAKGLFRHWSIVATVIATRPWSWERWGSRGRSRWTTAPRRGSCSAASPPGLRRGVLCLTSDANTREQRRPTTSGSSTPTSRRNHPSNGAPHFVRPCACAAPSGTSIALTKTIEKVATGQSPRQDRIGVMGRGLWWSSWLVTLALGAGTQLSARTRKTNPCRLRARLHSGRPVRVVSRKRV